MSRHCNLHIRGASARRRLRAAFATLALAACGLAAGQSLAPGGSVATSGTSLAASPHLAGTSPIPDDSHAFSLLTPGGVATGTLTQWVVHSVDNTYDFYWVIHNDAGSLGRVDSLTIQNFLQDPTSLLIADFRLDDIGSVGSSLATRSPGNGSKIEFSFLGGLGPGETSHALLLDSKALGFSHAGFATLGGLGGGLTAAFGTAVPAVPEPSTSALLLLCLALGAGAAGARRRLPPHWRLLAALALALPAAAQAQPRYAVVDLGTLGLDSSRGSAINASGQVAGSARSPSDGFNHAVLWSGAAATDLGTLGAPTSYASGINARGQVVGNSYVLPCCHAVHAALWEGGTAIDLGALPGGHYSQATDINDHAQVAGFSSFSGDSTIAHAVRWDGRTIVDVGVPGAESSEANAINDSGQMAGEFSTRDAAGHVTVHAARWTGAVAEDLGGLGGPYSLGLDINDAGVVVGDYRPSADSNVRHAVRWTGSVAEDLGTLGGVSSAAFGINSFGDIVGYADSGAFLYTAGHMVDLNTLVPASSGWVLAIASDINDHGWITGYGRIGGEYHAFLLTPAVPEPSALATLLAGLGLVGWLARRRRTA